MVNGRVRLADTPVPSLAEIYRPIEPGLRRVDGILREIARGSSHVIRDMAGHLVRKPGKRVRAAMVLFSARCGHADAKRAAQLAAVVEMLHLASLIHDDILDGADKRRNQRSLHKVWGNHLSVLMGDYLFARMAGMLTSAFHREVLKVVIRGAENMVMGQIEEEAVAFRHSLPVSGYLGIIRLKTAEMMAASCEAGGALAGATPAVRRSLRKYGLEFGMGFQLTDDAMDYSAESKEIGKPVGSYLSEGRFTFPLICLLKRLRGKERRHLLSLLNKSALSNGGAGRVVELVRKSGCVPGTLGLAERRFVSAHRALKGVPVSAARSLAGLADFASSRKR